MLLALRGPFFELSVLKIYPETLILKYRANILNLAGGLRSLHGAQSLKSNMSVVTDFFSTLSRFGCELERDTKVLRSQIEAPPKSQSEFHRLIMVSFQQVPMLFCDVFAAWNRKFPQSPGKWRTS